MGTRRSSQGMTLETFFEKFDQFADAPNAVGKMRELVLELAVQGKLVEQRASDGDGHALLRRLRQLPPERNSKSRSPKDITVEPESLVGIPKHWALTTVENTTRETGFFCDGDWVESKDQDPDGDVRLIQLADVGDGEYRDRSSRFMTKAATKRLNCSFLEAGDILVARMPDPLGRCCRFPGDSKPAVTVVDVCILRPNVAFFDPEFLVIAINCPRFRRLVSAQATGTTRSRISRSNLGVLPIPLPPLAEQKRIVAKVDELMALCDQLEAQQQEREARHAVLARAALARFADAPTPANLQFLFHPSCAIPPADLRRTILTLAVHGKLVRFEPDEVAQTVGDHIEFQNGYAFKGEWFKPDGMRLCRNVNVSHGVLDWRESVFVDGKVAREFNRFALGEGDIVLSLDRPLITTGLKVARVKKSDLPCLLLQRVAKPVPKHDQLDMSYFFLWLNSSEFVDSIDPGRSNGVPHISTRQVQLLPFVLPPLAEQRRIVAKVDELMALVDQLEAQLATSKATAAKLLSAVVAELTGPRQP